MATKGTTKGGTLGCIAAGRRARRAVVGCVGEVVVSAAAPVRVAPALRAPRAACARASRLRFRVMARRLSSPRSSLIETPNRDGGTFTRSRDSPPSESRRPLKRHASPVTNEVLKLQKAIFSSMHQRHFKLEPLLLHPVTMSRLNRS